MAIVPSSLFNPRAAVTVGNTTEQAVLGFMNYAYDISNQIGLRRQMEEIDRYYYTENNASKAHAVARVLNRLGDKTKLAEMNIPLIMTQVESGVSYFQETFLTGSPIFALAANNQYMDEAMMLEAIFEENANQAGWAANLLKCYRDGLKYNLMAAHVDWEFKSLPAVANDVLQPNAAKASMEWWQGNVITHLPLYQVSLDTRVEPGKVHERGEFAYFTELINRIELKQFVVDMTQRKAPLRNIKAAFESRPDGSGMFAYYWPSINKEVFQNISGGEFNWMQWLNGTINNGTNIQYAATYHKTTLYARILPGEFGISAPAKNTPQIWKFIIINGKHVIYAERMPTAHGYLPILVGQPHDDGLRYQSKSIAQNAKPFQDMASAMWNIHLQAWRRSVTDRVLYDPSAIDEAQMNNPNPSAKIPTKPAAQGRDIRSIVYQFPYQNNTAGLINEAAAVVQFANQMNGQNPATQGQFVKGNKTRTEFNEIVGNANSRNRQLALNVEATFHKALKEILLTNVLTFQTTKDIQVRSRKETVTFDPVAVRDAPLVFKIADGLNPVDKQMDGDAIKSAFTVLSTVPAIGQEYNVGDTFAYLMKLQGADLGEFRKSDAQRAYEQALASWQQSMVAHAESLKNAGEGALQMLQQHMPPQPKPADYGYVIPGAQQGVLQT